MFTTMLVHLRRPRLAVALGVALVVTLAVVNGADLPGTVPWLRRATGHAYLDFCAFCGAARVRGELDGLGDVGREAQRRLMLGLDLLIPSLSLAFASTALASLGARRLLALPLAAFALDLGENAAILALLAAYPRPSAAAWALGALSGLKFVAYGLSVASLAVLGARARWTRGAA